MTAAEKSRNTVHLPLATLQSALAKVSPAMPGPSVAVPVLRAVRIEKCAGGVHFTATDLDMAIRATVPGENDESPAFLISGERLMSFVKLLDGADIAVTPGESRTGLTCGRSRAQIPTMQVKDYPHTALEPEGDALLSVPQGVLARAIRHTSFAIGDDIAKPAMRGALLEVNHKGLRLVSVDGHRMAIYDVRFESLGAGSQLIPGAMILALGKALDEESAAGVNLYDSGNNLLAAIDGELPVSISHRKLAGSFPSYRHAIEVPTCEVVIRVSATEMLAAVNRCTAMSDVRSYAVNLRVSEDLIELRAVDDNAGENLDSIAAGADTDFPQFTTRFSGKYLIDGLRRVKGDVILSFPRPTNRAFLKLTCSPAEGEEFTYVVMPMTMRAGEQF